MFYYQMIMGDRGEPTVLEDAYFQGQTKALQAFQVVINLPYESADCFKVNRPVVVPAKTFLSQLL